MKEEIETLREELNRLTEGTVCLYSEKIIKISQKLDKLICAYYKNAMLA